LRAPDICRLTAFVAATEQEHDACALSAKVDAIARPQMDTQLDDTLTDSGAVAEIARLQLPQADPDPSLSVFVA